MIKKNFDNPSQAPIASVKKTKEKQTALNGQDINTTARPRRRTL